MEDKISIIVPVYNAERYLRKCLDSISNQTYKNLQIILVDDGSEDSSYDICKEYEMKDSRFKVYHQRNLGQATARNVGLSFADGDWIGFADNDDVLELNMYEILLTNAHNCKCLISGCATNTVYENGESINKFSDISSGIKDGDAIALNILYQTRHAWGAMWNKIFHKSLLDKLRYPDGYQLEDYWVSIRLYHEVKNIYFDNRPLYNWTCRSTSQSHKAFGKEKISIFEMSEKINKYCIETGNRLLCEGGAYFSYIEYVGLIWNIFKFGDKESKIIAKNMVPIAKNNLSKISLGNSKVNKKVVFKNYAKLLFCEVKLRDLR